MNIVLLGYRGAGKSSVAKILSKKLKREVFSIDSMIVEAMGMAIPQLVEEWGWPRFREIESAMVAKVADEAKDAIIDCGGGVVLADENIRRLRRGGKTVLLHASLEAILKRIRHDPNRPPLKNGLSFEEEQRRALSEREEKYHASADIKYDTSAASPEATAKAITKRFTDNGWL